MNVIIWEIFLRPERKFVLTSMWIYNINHNVNGRIDKQKARFVMRGFSQKEVIDYDYTFAPIERYTSIRYILALVVVMIWKIHQMDVKITFLNGVDEEEAYIEKPLGFETHNR